MGTLKTVVHAILPEENQALARRAAGWLRRRGLGRGDRVAVIAANDPRLLALAHGALRTGVVPVFVNPALHAPERAWIVEDSEPAAVVDDLDAIPWSDAAEAELAPLPLGHPMLYTSGTTGRPKGVWRGVLSEEQARAWAEDERDLWAPEQGATFLVCSPLYHSAGYRSATAALTAGARVLLLERFDAETVVELLSEEPVTGTFLVPTHLRRIFAAGDPPPPRAARRVLHAGEECPGPLKHRAMEWLPQVLWEFYGSTEGQFTAISPQEWLEHPGSVGRARRGRRLEIAEPDEEGVGAVFVSAPPFARWEYWRDPERTRRAWRDDLFTVGDLGRLDADGYLSLVARREDLVISGGVNVYPAEIERVLHEHPDVHEVVVFGVPDPEWGERVCAAVVAETEGEPIERWLRERLDGPQRPKAVIVVEAFPRTATGKIDRARLRSLAADVWTGPAAGRPSNEMAERARRRPEPRGPGGLIDAAKKAVVSGAAADLDARDPDFIRSQLPLMWLLATIYFRAEVRGFERVPEEGPVLFVGNHSGGNIPVDSGVFMLAFNTYFGVERPVYALAHALVTSFPIVGALGRKWGIITADPDIGKAALSRGACVLVYPGGDVETHRPWTARNEVRFDGRKGFIRLAQEAGVPIVPVVSVGGQETFLPLTDGRRLADALRLDKLGRLKILPLSLAMPWGLNVGDMLGHIPFPAKIKQEILEPIDVRERFGGPGGVDRAYEYITAHMQETLTKLATERVLPPLL